MMTNPTLLPFQPDTMTQAQLAGVSFPARHSGRTHTLYAFQSTRSWTGWQRSARSTMIEHMFDLAISDTAAPSLAELRALLERLAKVDGAGASQAELVDQLTVMEQLKSGLAAAQARVTATLVATRSRVEATRGVPARERCRGLAAEVALARQDSPVRGNQHLGAARALVHEMPDTHAALTRGEISEYRATLMVKETALLSRTHRRQVDAELAGRLAGLGDRAVAAEARRIGYRLDPGSVLRRTRGARGDRHVGLRPAPDTMTYLTGFLPVEQGVACQVALQRHADSLRSRGDQRSRGQIMADTLVERVTGQASADAALAEIQLVMTDQALIGDSDEPARVPGFGPIPAAIARGIVRAADRAWIRRLYTTPDRSALVAMDSGRRPFAGGLRRFLIARDDTCRTPWCDAPIRHLDHVVPIAEGGPTTADNGQGLCEACNYAKEAVGWRAERPPGTHHEVETTTPTGHRYRSRAPHPPGLRIDVFVLAA
jgi:hypothetical protein